MRSLLIFIVALIVISCDKKHMISSELKSCLNGYSLNEKVKFVKNHLDTFELEVIAIDKGYDVINTPWGKNYNDYYKLKMRNVDGDSIYFHVSSTSLHPDRINYFFKNGEQYIYNDGPIRKTGYEINIGDKKLNSIYWNVKMGWMNKPEQPAVINFAPNYGLVQLTDYGDTIQLVLK